MKKCLINYNIAVPADHQATIISQPGKSSLHCPSTLVASQLAAIVIFSLLIVTPVGANQLDAPVFQTLPQRIAVIAFVCDNPLGFLSRMTPALARYGDGLYGLFEQRDFRRGRRVQVVSQRKTLAVDHHHPLRAFAPLGLSDLLAPFLAGAKLPSTNASDQSSWPRSSNTARKARHILSQTLCSSQRFKRRQQVEGLGYRLGKSAQGAPVRRIQRIPSNTLRLSAQGRPPFRDFFGWGNNGSICFHCLSDSFHRSLAIEKLLSMAVYHKSLHDASLNCA